MVLHEATILSYLIFKLFCFLVSNQFHFSLFLRSNSFNQRGAAGFLSSNIFFQGGLCEKGLVFSYLSFSVSLKTNHSGTINPTSVNAGHPNKTGQKAITTHRSTKLADFVSKLFQYIKKQMGRPAWVRLICFGTGNSTPIAH